MKPFRKIECAILDRFEDDWQLLLFFKLLCLCDREGRIHMDYDALAARIRWKRERLEDVMARLMEPNPESKCKKFEGRCVAFIDPNKPWLGFIIPGYTRHRKSNVMTQKRRDDQNRWAREKRAAKRRQATTPDDDTRRQRDDTRRQRDDCHSLGTTTGDDSATTHDDTKSTAIKIRDLDSDNKNLKTHSRDVTRAREVSGKPKSEDPDVICNLDEAKRYICEKIYRGKITGVWAYEVELELSRHLGTIRRSIIDKVAEHLHYTDSDPGELKPFMALQIPGLKVLVRDWQDYVARAVAFDEKLEAGLDWGSPPQPELWDQFCIWKYPACDKTQFYTLRFWDLPYSVQRQYRDEFPQFVAATLEGEAAAAALRDYNAWMDGKYV
jgi:hypothetical protein